MRFSFDTAPPVMPRMPVPTPLTDAQLYMLGGIVILIIVAIIIANIVSLINSDSSPIIKPINISSTKTNGLDNTVSLCEADAGMLSCPTGTTIDTGTVQYGRWDNTLCLHTSVSAATAPIKKSYPLTSLCNGKNSCDIKDVIVSLKDDPYPNIYKQIQIDYKCKA